MNKITVLSNEKTQSLGDLYGIFFEDINHAADGGLYGELVRNRSFEFACVDNPSYRSTTAWEKVEKNGGKLSFSVENKNGLGGQNPNYLVVEVYNVGEKAGIKNYGYGTGIPVVKDRKYNFSVFAKTREENMTVRAVLESPDGKVYAEKVIDINSGEWKKYETELCANDTDYNGRLAIYAENTGKFYMDMVSLFPKDTYKNRPNGMRKDIAEMLEAMHPKFMRFPGGCLIHDGSMNKDDRDSAYRWKNTIGDVEKRPSRKNNWGYNQSLGLGYYEYFQFCEDINTKPVPILPAGYNPHSKQAVAIDDLGEWIEDALDLIEFANGDVTTKWGKIRADLGHEKPFNLEYIGVGNEEVGQEFFDRYTYFHKAIKEKYPEIKIINTSGPFAQGAEYERGWKSARDNGSDLVDEHYYTSPEWFLANQHRYDNFSADGPKVFLGEYATWGNTYYNALVEASFMVGLERNAHAVSLACYAPMLCHVDYINWQPDMIWFNNHDVYGSANYYVQKMFMTNQGTDLVKIKADGLDKITVLGEENINGEIVFETDRAAGIFSNIEIRNDKTGEVKKYTDITADGPKSFHIDDISCGDYTISMTAKKTSGSRGFRVLIGKKDDDNYIVWNIAGWANQDSEIASRINGRNSTIGHTMFTVDTDVEYKLEMRVKGREIDTFINGVHMNHAEDKQPVIEELYYTASVDTDTNDVILKVVNVSDTAVKSMVEIDGVEKIDGKISEIVNCDLESKNSFENPTLISPKERQIAVESNNFEYEFDKHSITIFRIKK